MKIAIRADASETIGSGHIMRCLTLANALKRGGAEVSFFSYDLPPSLHERIISAGHRAVSLPNSLASFNLEQKVDWLVIDHYGLDRTFESAMRPLVRRILVLDDLANREHDCDVLLDQNYYLNAQQRYNDLTPPDCELFIGPRFALLRPEFYQARSNLRKRTGRVERILIFFGGADSTNETLKALRGIETLALSGVQIDVLLGSLNPHLSEIQKAVAKISGAKLYQDVSDISSFIASADLALGAGGTTSWERAFLGLPTLSVQVATNQTELSNALASAGVIEDLGWHENVTSKDFAREVSTFIQSSKNISEMEKNALQLMGGVPAGSVPQIVGRILGTFIRPIRETDLKMVLQWRNSDRIRSQLYTDHIISWQEHLTWFKGLKNKTTQDFQVFALDDQPSGIVQFTEIDKVAQTGSWGFYLGSEDLPRGSGLIMGYLGIEYAFHILGLTELHGEAFRFNEKSVRYHLKLGFEPVQGQNKSVLKNGKNEEILLFRLTRDAWQKKRAELIERPELQTLKARI